MKIEYLLFNVIIILGPFLAQCFLSKKIVRPKLLPTLISIGIVSSVFIVFDEIVTNYFWYFNSNYITGIKIGQLPIEEIVFFFTVPYACLFLWVNYKTLFKEDVGRKIISNILYIAIVLIISVVVLSLNKIYTGTILAILALVLFLDQFISTHLFSKRYFLIFIFGIVNVLTFIFNWYLTARPIVTYNLLLKTNINIITVPVEDFIYGFCMIALILIIYEKRLKY